MNGWLRQTAGPNGYTITTAYDAAGSKTGVTDSLGNTLWGSATYAYGIGPFLLGATDIDLGAWTYGYDALGEMTSWKDAKGQPFTAAYDALSRMTDRYEPDLYSHWTWGTSAAAHEIGRLKSVCSGTGTNPTNCTTSPGYGESETYDALGRLYKRAIQIPSDATYTYTWQYNSTTGLLDTLTYPTSTAGYSLNVKYGYAYGVLQSITDVSDSPNVTLWTANAQNARGLITQDTLGNGVVETRNFDDVTGWLASIQAGAGGGAALQNQSYLYDYVGNLTERQENNLGLTENIYYDNLYRLDHTTLTGSSGTTAGLQMTYDAMGNITSRSDINNGATWTYDPNHVHRVLTAGDSSHVYTYDANGNAITRNGFSETWSASNYPTALQSGWLKYGPGRELYWQKYSGTDYTEYVGDLLEEVVGVSNGVTTYRHYVYANGRAVAIYDRDTTSANTWRYVLSDHEGSVSSFETSTGSLITNVSFAPFGWYRSGTTWTGVGPAILNYTRRGFTSQNMLGTSSGLVHMKGRVEDSFTGRFISPDPNIPDPSNTQSFNRYSYVNNNPLSYIDPSGFCPGTTEDGDSFDDGQPCGEVTVTGTPDWSWTLGSSPGSSLGPSGNTGGAPALKSPTIIPCKPGEKCYVAQNQRLQENQLDSRPCLSSEETPSLTATGKFGAFGEAEVEFAEKAKVHGELNLVTVNMPISGNDYLTQGIGISAEFFGVKTIPLTTKPLGIGVERTSYDGGLTWSDWNWYGTRDNLTVSSEGLDASVAAGLFVGGEVRVSHLENMLTGDTPCGHAGKPASTLPE